MSWLDYVEILALIIVMLLIRDYLDKKLDAFLASRPPKPSPTIDPVRLPGMYFPDQGLTISRPIMTHDLFTPGKHYIKCVIENIGNIDYSSVSLSFSLTTWTGRKLPDSYGMIVHNIHPGEKLIGTCIIWFGIGLGRGFTIKTEDVYVVGRS